MSVDKGRNDFRVKTPKSNWVAKDVMSFIIILLTLAAAGTGLRAAYKWGMASKVEIDLGYHPPGLPGGTMRRMGQDFPRIPESGDGHAQLENQIISTWEAIREASALNKIAARWTAISVGLAALAAILGVIAGI